GFIATSRYYADFMAGYLRIPREKIDVVYPGINLKGHGRSEPEALAREGAALANASGSDRDCPFTIGYFARISPEKGLNHLIDAFILLKQIPGLPPARLRVSGWLGDHNRPFFEEQKAKLARVNLLADFDHVETPDHAGKVRF